VGNLSSGAAWHPAATELPVQRHLAGQPV